MRRTHLKAVSDRRRKRDSGYPSSRKAIFERAGGMCEVMATLECQRQGHQVHHIAGRSGPDPHRLDGLLLVCRHCHDFIHDQPEIAYQRGWMIRRNGTPDA